MSLRVFVSLVHESSRNPDLVAMVIARPSLIDLFDVTRWLPELRDE